MIEKMEEVLAGGGIVVAESDRLARSLRIEFARRRRAEGAAVWKAPAILSLRAWMDKTWAEAWPSETVLAPSQEIAVMRRCVERSGGAAVVLNPLGLAREALKAVHLCLRHDVERATAKDHPTLEESSFAGWMECFLAELKSNSWLCRQQLPGRLAAMIRRGEVKVPTSVALAGFLELEPSMRGIFKALEERGCSIVQLLSPYEAPGARELRRPASQVDELASIAGEVQKILLAHAGNPDEAPRIGILVPDLRAIRPAFERVLRDALAPYTNLPGQSGKPVAWRFLRGRALAEHPLIAGALLVCGLRAFGNTSADISRLLLDGSCWGGEGDALRARMDLSLRERGGRYVSLVELSSLASRLGAETASVATRIAGLHAHLVDEPRTQLPSGWAQSFSRRMAALGWPHRGTLSSDAFQAHERWLQCLAELAQLDAQVEAMDSAQAFAWLDEIVRAREFEARAENDEAVLIGDYEDASGIRFDHLYLLGASSTALPKASVPTPFVPRAHLQKAGAPDATPDAALERARKLLQMLEKQAPRVVYSCPVLDAHGALLTPCGLLAGWPAGQSAGPEAASAVDAIVAGGIQCARPASDPVPAIRPEHAHTVRGGVSILQNFAEAPFYAYIRNRLVVRDFPVAREGIDASLQGTLVHRVLETFWAAVRTQEQLRAMDAQARAAAVERALDSACAEEDLFLPEHWGAELVRLERRRIAKLVLDWLDFEAARSHPFEVIAVEHEAEAAVAGVPMKFKLDRIDRVEVDGAERFLLIDYKTGFTAGYDGWMPDSLTAPQLPLYAAFDLARAAGVPKIDGIAYAQVTDQPGFSVLSNFGTKLHAGKDGTIGRPAPDFSQLLTTWKDRLEVAGGAFCSGAAGIARATIGKSFANKPLDVLLRQGGEA